MGQLSLWATPAEPPLSRACELQQEKLPHHERVAPAPHCQSLPTAVRTQHRGKKSNGWEAVYKIVTPRFPVVSNTNILLSLIPPGSKWFTAVALCLAFFPPSIPVGGTSICLYLEQSTIYLDTHVARVHRDPFLSLPSTPPGSEYPPLPQEVDSLIICGWTLALLSAPQEASINDSIHLLQQLVQKKHGVSDAK